MPEIFFNKKALRWLHKLSKNNKKDLEKINNNISKLSKYPIISNLWIKKLKGKYSNLFCIKVKQYRIKFVVEDNNIYITEIDERKDAYK